MATRGPSLTPYRNIQNSQIMRYLYAGVPGEKRRGEYIQFASIFYEARFGLLAVSKALQAIFDDLKYQTEMTFLFKSGDPIPFCLKNPFLDALPEGEYIERQMSFQAAMHSVIAFTTGKIATPPPRP